MPLPASLRDKTLSKPASAAATRQPLHITVTEEGIFDHSLLGTEDRLKPVDHSLRLETEVLYPGATAADFALSQLQEAAGVTGITGPHEGRKSRPTENAALNSRRR